LEELRACVDGLLGGGVLTFLTVGVRAEMAAQQETRSRLRLLLLPDSIKTRVLGAEFVPSEAFCNRSANEQSRSLLSDLVNTL
jgi:hypothetical protein